MIIQIRIGNFAGLVAGQLNALLQGLALCPPSATVTLPGGPEIAIHRLRAGSDPRDIRVYTSKDDTVTRGVTAKTRFGGLTTDLIRVNQMYVELGLIAEYSFFSELTKPAYKKGATPPTLDATLFMKFTASLVVKSAPVSGVRRPVLELTFVGVAPTAGLDPRVILPDSTLSIITESIRAAGVQQIPIDLTALAPFLPSGSSLVNVGAGTVGTPDSPDPGMALRFQYSGGEFDELDGVDRWRRFYNGDVNFALGERPADTTGAPLPLDGVSIEIDHDLLRPIFRKAIADLDHLVRPPVEGEKPLRILDIREVSFGVSGTAPSVHLDYECEVINACPCGPGPLLGLSTALIGDWTWTWTDLNVDVLIDGTLSVGAVTRALTAEGKDGLAVTLPGLLYDANGHYSPATDETTCCVLTAPVIAGVIGAAVSKGNVLVAAAAFSFTMMYIIHRAFSASPFVAAKDEGDKLTSTICSVSGSKVHCDQVVALPPLNGQPLTLSRAVGLQRAVGLDLTVGSVARPVDMKAWIEVDFEWTWDPVVLGDICHPVPGCTIEDASGCGPAWQFVAATAMVTFSGPAGAKICSIQIAGDGGAGFNVGGTGARVSVFSGNSTERGADGTPLNRPPINFNSLPSLWSIELTARGSRQSFRKGGHVTLLVVTTAGTRYLELELPSITEASVAEIMKERERVAKKICGGNKFLPPGWGDLSGFTPPGGGMPVGTLGALPRPQRPATDPAARSRPTDEATRVAAGPALSLAMRRDRGKLR